uniref:Uncharacterized protein n=1 Tax=Romanomermis culicivorax TaxID=13658 RepID=A0A915HR68_ROMCU
MYAVECVKVGYRHFTLLDINGEPMLNSTLFVHVAVTNKRGGGKPKKRGVSVRRKYSKIQTGIKQIGIKRLDDAFKAKFNCCSSSLHKIMQNELTQWQESCGLGPAATMRQGLRLLHSRVLAASNTSSNAADLAYQSQFLIDIDEGFPRIELEGNVPDILRKSCQSFEKVIAQCRRIIERSDALICKVEEQCKRINDCYQEVCNDENDVRPKGQQATRASENFAWNCRLLKSQTETMEKILEECREYIKQITNTACLLNVLKIQCQQPCQHRTQQTNNI